MIFKATKLRDAYVVDIQPFQDERGFFARTWCENEFTEQGLDPNLAQCSVSFNRRAGTVRGLHVQLPPYADSMLVRCTQGALYDVIIDLRTDSDSYMQWVGVELTAKNRRALYVPKGFAHGFMTMEDDTEAFYMISEFFAPDSARGIRWDDKRFDIQWPGPVNVISAKDLSYPDYDAAEFTLTVAESLQA